MGLLYSAVGAALPILSSVGDRMTQPSNICVRSGRREEEEEDVLGHRTATTSTSRTKNSGSNHHLCLLLLLALHQLLVRKKSGRPHFSSVCCNGGLSTFII
jgi:hypothetical protein